MFFAVSYDQVLAPNSLFRRHVGMQCWQDDGGIDLRGLLLTVPSFSGRVGRSDP